tara:strand:- start:262 stop:867 length:606 start_codon:yes stop_codon:yes gene_type:complete
MFKIQKIVFLFCGFFVKSSNSLLPPPSPIFQTSSIIHNVLNVGVPLIVPAHGSVDIFHSIQENKTKNYIGSTLMAYVSYPLINHVSEDASLFLFLALSAYHFRHQFELAGTNLSPILSSAFIYFGYNHPDILYIFLAFIHTPHQYWKFREYVLKDKVFSTIVVTFLTGLGMFFSYNDWSNNVFITSTLVAHILYQEFIRFV